MLKWIIVIGVIAAIYFLFIKKKPAVQNSKTTNNNKEKDEVKSNDMVECATCGTYCEVSDCILSSNKYYCCDECLEKA